jgi:hypothetical protein
LEIVDPEMVIIRSGPTPDLVIVATWEDPVMVTVHPVLGIIELENGPGMQKTVCRTVILVAPGT